VLDNARVRLKFGYFFGICVVWGLFSVLTEIEFSCQMLVHEGGVGEINGEIFACDELVFENEITVIVCCVLTTLDLLKLR